MSQLQVCNCKEKLRKMLRGTGFNDNFLMLPEFDTVMVLKLIEKQCKENKYYIPFEGTNYDTTYIYECCVIGMEVYTIEEMYQMIEIKFNHRKHQL